MRKTLTACALALATITSAHAAELPQPVKDCISTAAKADARKPAPAASPLLQVLARCGVGKDDESQYAGGRVYGLAQMDALGIKGPK